MEPAFCAGIVVQLSISRKRAMKSCHPAESGAPRANRQMLSRTSLTTIGSEFFYFAPFLHPSKL
jgi:hypothetical protein